MFRRMRKFLANRKEKSWKLNDPEGSVNWENLPTEMRREIVKYLEIPERCRLRVCSKKDRDIVDSLPIKLPLVRLESTDLRLGVSFVHGPDHVVRVDFKMKPIFKTKPTVMISYNYDGLDPVETHPNYKHDLVLHSLYSFITRKNITVETLSLLIETANPVLQDFLYQLHAKDILKNFRVFCSSVSFVAFNLYFLKVIETRCLYEVEIPLEHDQVKIFLGKKIHTDPTGFQSFDTYFTKCSQLVGNVGSLIASILWNINSPSKYFLLPGYQQEDPVGLCERYSGRYVKFPGDIHLLSLPVQQDDTKRLIVKISQCGVVILKELVATLPDSLRDYPDHTCGLRWMCKTCDPSVESWFFRKSVKIE